MTPTLTPSLALTMSRIRRADRSLSSGNNAAYPRSTFDRSIPLLAQMKPCLVSVMMRSPRRRTMRTASSSTSCLWLRGSFGSISTSRPSAFETIFCVTTRTSKSCNSFSDPGAHDDTMMSPTWSPGTISPIPSMPHALNRFMTWHPMRSERVPR